MKNVYILTRILLLQTGLVLFLSATSQTITITSADLIQDPNSISKITDEVSDRNGIPIENSKINWNTNTGFVELGDGVAAVDTASNRIYASAATVDKIEPEQKIDLLIYPNPFSSSTTIKFVLEKNANVQLKIYNLFGKEIKVLEDGELLQGEHRVLWNGTQQNGSAATMGIYICRLIKDGEVSNVQRLIINR